LAVVEVVDLVVADAGVGFESGTVLAARRFGFLCVFISSVTFFNPEVLTPRIASNTAPIPASPDLEEEEEEAVGAKEEEGGGGREERSGGGPGGGGGAPPGAAGADDDDDVNEDKDAPFGFHSNQHDN